MEILAYSDLVPAFMRRNHCVLVGRAVYTDPGEGPN